MSRELTIKEKIQIMIKNRKKAIRNVSFWLLKARKLRPQWPIRQDMLS